MNCCHLWELYLEYGEYIFWLLTRITRLNILACVFFLSTQTAAELSIIPKTCFMFLFKKKKLALWDKFVHILFRVHHISPNEQYQIIFIVAFVSKGYDGQCYDVIPAWQGKVIKWSMHGCTQMVHCICSTILSLPDQGS